ncbi:MAG: DUF86 domain-containing protein, partial [Bacilli bacterium]|nr:DUF86 domain-containing protein [Bacilli bacterium]
DFNEIDSATSFTNSSTKRRAILFSFMQIGELCNHLSKTFLNAFNNDACIKLIAIRNRIVHGYYTIRDDVIYDSVKNDLPKLINDLNDFSRKHYAACLRNYIGKKVVVYIDRPIGYIHNDIFYKHNYGHIKEITALDGEFQDAYVLPDEKPLYSKEGIVIAIIHRLNDIEDKLIVVDKNTALTDEQIEEMVSFQEQFFEHEIIR